LNFVFQRYMWIRALNRIHNDCQRPFKSLKSALARPQKVPSSFGLWRISLKTKVSIGTPLFDRLCQTGYLTPDSVPSLVSKPTFLNVTPVSVLEKIGRCRTSEAPVCFLADNCPQNPPETLLSDCSGHSTISRIQYAASRRSSATICEQSLT
jgi:hypothetical protein